MLESINNQFKFKELTPQEKESRGILARLYGPCASFRVGTRNDRFYSDKLWERVFQNALVKELLDNGGIPGELDHPADRSETDSSKIAIMMPEAPKKDDNGNLMAYFDIIDTPCGRIAYQLGKYGFNLGVSSRGDGDIKESYDGTEEVDPDTYTLNAFDLVLIPALKNARLKMAEGLDENKAKFKQAILESLEKANPDEKKIMEDTLTNLNIDYSPEKDSDIEVVDEKDKEANDVGDDLIKQLQESLQREKEQELQLKELHEKLSVCYAKETKLNEELNKYKSSVITLSDSARKVKALQTRVDSLQEKLNDKEKAQSDNESRIQHLVETQKRMKVNEQRLTESLNSKDEITESLKEQVKTLTESLETQKQQKESEMQSLKEGIEELKKNSAIKSTEFKSKIKKATELVEKYQKIAKTAMSKYIDVKATQLGLDSIEVTNKLNENYSFSDIDKVCEKLQEYKVNITKLPFSLDENSRVKITESKNTSPIKPVRNDADEIDENSLISLFGYKEQ